MATNHEINVITGKLDKVGMTAAEAAAYLLLDQSTPQTITGGAAKFQANDIQTTETDRIVFANDTASLVGTTVQYSPSIRLTSHSWNTTTGADNYHDWRITNIPASGSTANCKGTLYFRTSYNGEAFASVMYLSYYGTLTTTASMVSPTFTASTLVDIAKASIGAASSTGGLLQVSTSASEGTPVRYSPRLVFRGRAWNTTPTAASNSINFGMEVRPTSGASTAGSLYWAYDNNDGGYTDIMQLTSSGTLLPNRLYISPSITTTTVIGINMYPLNATSSGTPVRYSPALLFTGRAWNTTPTAASNDINFKQEVIPETGATTSGRLAWSFDNNGGGYTERMYLTSDGNLVLGTKDASGSSQLEVTKTSSTSYAKDMAAVGLPRNGVTNRDTTANNAAEYVMGTFSANGTYGSAVRMMGIFTSHTDSQISGEWQLVTRNAGTFVEAIRVTKEGILTTQSGKITKITEATDTYQILVTDDTVVFNKATAFTATMPAATVGQRFYFKNIGAGNVTIAFPASVTCDGVDDDIILTQNDAVILQCNTVTGTTNWMRM